MCNSRSVSSWTAGTPPSKVAALKCLRSPLSDHPRQGVPIDMLQRQVTIVRAVPPEAVSDVPEALHKS